MISEETRSAFALLLMLPVGALIALIAWPNDGKWVRWRVAALVVAGMFGIPPLVRLWIMGMLG